MCWPICFYTGRDSGLVQIAPIRPLEGDANHYTADLSVCRAMRDWCLWVIEGDAQPRLRRCAQVLDWQPETGAYSRQALHRLGGSVDLSGDHALGGTSDAAAHSA
jgi:hypothetical protein